MGTAAIVSLSIAGAGLLGGAFTAWRQHRLRKWAATEGLSHLTTAAIAAIKAEQDAKKK